MKANAVQVIAILLLPAEQIKMFKEDGATIFLAVLIACCCNIEPNPHVSTFANARRQESFLMRNFQGKKGIDTQNIIKKRINEITRVAIKVNGWHTAENTLAMEIKLMAEEALVPVPELEVMSKFKLTPANDKNLVSTWLLTEHVVSSFKSTHIPRYPTLTVILAYLELEFCRSYAFCISLKKSELSLNFSFTI
ncbi:hypothetical protein CLIB1423_01S09406 [[Candida] railenensis]|uniref:Uncharacterized protein n=1 Tax=[Candida] railenensis TaxID=45579 RepID=A0A9P0QKU6_9ASCO|nr:hypothetical protein CLIB1423_01S09406 [[Candida] railenensis]